MGLTRTRSRDLLAESGGQAITEYALILAAIALLLVLGILFFAGHLSDAFHKSSSQPPSVLRPPSSAQCDQHYVGACVPRPPPDHDCADLKAFGITGVVYVMGGDPQGLDSNHDGIACN